jgi:hypothetical protein
VTKCRWEKAVDVDVFKINFDTNTTVHIVSSGRTDVLAYLYNEGGVLIESDVDGVGVPNFRITANLAPGIYYAKVTGYDNTTSAATR